MKTLLLKTNPLKPEREIIDIAADLLKRSELVAFPTETVYGLGAMAFDSQAVEKIYIAKGRPTKKPLLVHISKIEQTEDLVTELNEVAKSMMERFWPGPLSLILPAREGIPAIVTGGESTIGLRMPDHPVALALIDKAGPLAAPSANISGNQSPVTAEQVKADLDGKIAAIIDGGLTGIGLPSTIIDLTGESIRIVRYGGLPLEEIEAFWGAKIT